MTDQREQITEDPGAAPAAGGDEVAVRGHRPVDGAATAHDAAADAPPDLTAHERELLADLFAIVEEHADEVAQPVDRGQVVKAFVFACEHHADQRRQSG
jgi:GTP diphosphokinase / guanosine-3',5'-bis(diphosphate) 3'-diphosphatase